MSQLVGLINNIIKVKIHFTNNFFCVKINLVFLRFAAYLHFKYQTVIFVSYGITKIKPLTED